VVGGVNPVECFKGVYCRAPCDHEGCVLPGSARSRGVCIAGLRVITRGVYCRAPCDHEGAS
jgi:hypothetical protein